MIIMSRLPISDHYFRITQSDIGIGNALISLDTNGCACVSVSASRGQFGHWRRPVSGQSLVAVGLPDNAGSAAIISRR